VNTPASGAGLTARRRSSSREPLAGLFADVIRDDWCVLFDFDGPLCDLFSAPPWAVRRKRRTVRATRALKSVVLRYGAELPPLEDPHDPHELFRKVLDRLGAARGPGHPGLGDALHVCLDDQERKAARTARPTPGAAEAVELIHELGLRLAITSNNSAAAIRGYLDRLGLLHYYGTRPGTRGAYAAGPVVIGRSDDHEQMKPEPHCLLRAMERHGAVPANSLLIGDSESDIKAARAAGVTVCAYARDEEKYEQLTGAGADFTISHLSEITDALKAAAGRH